MRGAALLICLLSVATSLPTRADDDPLTDLMVAGGEYIAAGFQLGYLQQGPSCATFSQRDQAKAFEAAQQEVQQRITGEYFLGLVKSIRPSYPNLKAEVDRAVGEPSAANCRKAQGMYSASFKRSRTQWLSAVVAFDKWKDK